MKLLQHIGADSTSNMLLYGAIMFANIDYVSVADYVIKALLGGAVWFGFKLLQDYYSVKVRSHAHKQREEQRRKREHEHNR